MVLTILLTALFTAIVLIVLFAYLIRTKTMSITESRYGFEETCSRLEEVVKQTDGWGLPIEPWDFYQFLTNKDFEFHTIKNCKIYFVCNPTNANKIVNFNPIWTGLLPCSWAVYELKNGKVYVSKLNISLMSKFFSGVLGNVMSNVALKNKEFLKSIAAK